LRLVVLGLSDRKLDRLYKETGLWPRFLLVQHGG
jgi:hypothetical protein